MTPQDFIFDCEYGYHFNSMCENYYGRMDLMLNAVMLLGGSGSALAVLNSSAGIAKVSGIALAACSAVALLVKPAEKALLHRQAKCEYLRLKSCAPTIISKKLEQELIELQATSPNGLGLFEVPAFNRALNTLGYEGGQRNASLCARLMSALVH